jgi:hypothetical protein
VGYVENAPIPSIPSIPSIRLTAEAITSLAHAPPDCAFIAPNSFPHESAMLKELEEYLNSSDTHTFEHARWYEYGRYRVPAFRIRRIDYPCEI